MAKAIVPRGQQQEAMRRAHPKPYYSRVVSLVCPAVEGTPAFAITQPFGTDLWLLGIRVWLDAKPQDSTKRTEFHVLTGTEPVTDILDMDKWEDVLPILNQNNQREPWKIVDGRFLQEWSMMKFYEGKPRRFAVVAVRIGANDDNLRISFEISEG